MEKSTWSRHSNQTSLVSPFDFCTPSHPIRNGMAKRYFKGPAWHVDNFFFFCWFGFLTSSSTTRPYRGRAPKHVPPHMRQSWETLTSISAGHIILTPTLAVGSGRPQWESNPGPHLTSSGVARSTDWATAPPDMWTKNGLFWKVSSCARCEVSHPPRDVTMSDTWTKKEIFFCIDPCEVWQHLTCGQRIN